MYPNGAATVPAGSSTEFDVVGTGTDRLADIEFSYAILDNGQPVYDRYGYPLKVIGSVSNWRDIWFSGDSSCQIRGKFTDSFDSGHWGYSGYSCGMVRGYAHTGIRDGRVHFLTDFTVSKR
jgi:hypothetical protein